MSEQLTLIEAESDFALLLPEAERRKRYTATQVQKISERLDLILMLIACNAPIREIADRAHISHHTITELIGQHATLIAADMLRYSDWTEGLSAKFLALANQKAEDAPFKDLIAAHSFVGKLSLDRRLASQQLSGANGELAAEIKAESEALTKFREALRVEAEKLKPITETP